MIVQKAQTITKNILLADDHPGGRQKDRYYSECGPRGSLYASDGFGVVSVQVIERI
jgi:hypothetical protein